MIGENGERRGAGSKCRWEWNWLPLVFEFTYSNTSQFSYCNKLRNILLLLRAADREGQYDIRVSSIFMVFEITIINIAILSNKPRMPSEALRLEYSY